MKNFAVAISAVAFALPMFTGPGRAECLKYDTTATLTGKIAERIGYGESGHENAVVRYHALVVDKPLCFDSNEDYPAEQGVKVLELAISHREYCKRHPEKNCDEQFVDEFSKKYNGKTVKIVEMFYHAILAWDHTKVLMDVKKIN